MDAGGTHDLRLVALSVVIAMLASYAALDLGGRVTAAAGRFRLLWLSGGAFAMGTGIWAMHYIGMLAFTPPVPVLYHWPTVLVSLLAAVGASAIALFVVSRTEMGKISTIVGAILMGSGIAAMHYIGMEAMRLPALMTYHVPLVVVSVILAVVISLVALWLTFRLRSADSLWWHKLGSALVMGAAIPVMHYTGMAAVTFTPRQMAVDVSDSIGISSLGVVGICSVTLVVLGLAIITSLIDRRFSAQSMELESSEERYRQLVESARVILWRASINFGGFSFVNREAEELLGYAAAEWINRPKFWLDHVHPEDRSMAESHLAEVAEKRVTAPFEHRMLAADGRVVWLRTSIQSVHQTSELVGVMTDITERKLAQEAAEKASDLKGSLLGEIERLNDQLKRENHRMTSELEVTQRLQQMMLPRDKDLEEIPNLDIAGSMEPASEVGGDYYDVIGDAVAGGRGRVVFGIGDVTGHGLESGVIAIMLQTALRTLLANGPFDGPKFLEVLNRVIYDNVLRMQCDRSMTLSLLHYQDGVVTISGQHEEILVVRQDGNLERYDTLNLGFPLGIEKDILRLLGEVKVSLKPGDVMVAYTDGITEAIDCAGATYGIERLSNAVREAHNLPAREIREAILSNMREYVGTQKLLDDVSILVVKPSEVLEAR